LDGNAKEGIATKHFKVLLTDRIDKAGIAILEEKAEVKIASCISEETLAEEVHDVDALIVRVPAVITRKILENAKKLRVIARFGVGYDNIDVCAATERGIVVTYTPGANTLAVAEYTIALMFALAKYIIKSDKALREHQWEMRLDYPGIELTGKTLGIVGLGEIGVEVARLSKAIGMRVLYWSRTRKTDKEKELRIEYVPLSKEDLEKGLRIPEKLLKESHFISTHLALTEQTRGIIGAKEIAAMKEGAFLINTARGGLVDEKALYDALKTGKLAGAGLDVFEREPPYDSPLLSLDNVIVGPHVAALARDAMKRMSIWVAEDVLRVLNGENPLYPVNPQVLERMNK
jgi:D-3-phosphoglycerate dehydrogenase